MCDSKIPLIFSHFSPYVEHNSTTNTLDGVVFSIFAQSYLSCCNKTGNFTIMRKKNMAEILEEVETIGHAYAMPVSVPHLAINTVPEVYVRVLDHPGLSLVTHPTISTSNIMLSGLQNVWPLLAVLLLLSGYVSLIFWIAEFETPKRAFSRKFRSGYFQALWYSLISATTVGYGDKVPNSKVGKVIGVVWILSGISIAAAFTASITTLMAQMQSGLLEQVTIGNANKIGVIEGTVDQSLITLAGAAAVTRPTLKELSKLLHETKNDTEVILGVAVDPNHLRKYSNDYFPFDFVTQYQMTWPVSVGYLLKTSDSAALRCFKQQAFFRQLEVNDLIDKFTEHRPHRLEDKTEKMAKSIVRDADMEILLYATVALILIFLVICIIEVVFEKRAKRREQSQTDSDQEDQDADAAL